MKYIKSFNENKSFTKISQGDIDNRNFISNFDQNTIDTIKKILPSKYKLKIKESDLGHELDAGIKDIIEINKQGLSIDFRLSIFPLDDDWFYVILWERDKGHSNYLCDQSDGLEDCLIFLLKE